MMESTRTHVVSVGFLVTAQLSPNSCLIEKYFFDYVIWMTGSSPIAPLFKIINLLFRVKTRPSIVFLLSKVNRWHRLYRTILIYVWGGRRQSQNRYIIYLKKRGKEGKTIAQMPRVESSVSAMPCRAHAGRCDCLPTLTLHNSKMNASGYYNYILDWKKQINSF